MAASILNSSEPRAQPTFERPAVRGGARLRYEWCAISERTRLVQQWVRPPLYLNKAYHEKGWALSQLMSPTGGLLQDDLLEVDVQVAQSARVVLISPAACRVHTMLGGHAKIQQNFRVESEAFLDLWPAPLILQAGASLQQATVIDLEPSARVLLCELVTPGRIAFGEAFCFDAWHSNLQIRRAGELIAYENFSARPSRGDLADWRAVYPGGLYASIYYLSPDPVEAMIEAMHAIGDASLLIGASSLRAGGMSVKVIAEDGRALRRGITEIRARILQASPYCLPTALKRAQTFFH